MSLLLSTAGIWLNVLLKQRHTWQRLAERFLCGHPPKASLRGICQTRQLYQQLFPTSLSKKCDLNQSSMMQGSTHSAGLWMDFPSWVTNRTVWAIMWAGPAKKLTPNVSVSQEHFRFMRHPLTKSWTSKMFPKFGRFGWSKFRFLHIFS